jgi:hypothetical protein
MRAALDRGPWSIVISDHKMPRFTGPEALEVLCTSGLDGHWLGLASAGSGGSSATIGDE